MIIADLAYLEDISEGTTLKGGAYNHTVESGDTLSGITSYYYDDGTSSCYNSVAALNGISNPNVIHVGQKIHIPDSLPGCGFLVV